MPRLVHRVTGSVVDVPDDKIHRLYGMGYDVEKSAPAKKAPAKKAASSKSEK